MGKQYTWGLPTVMAKRSSECVNQEGNFKTKQAIYYIYISCPITGLNRPTGFQEVKALRFLDIGT
jgi:hypothetical protein